MNNKLKYCGQGQATDIFLKITALIISGLVLPLILVLLVRFTGFSEILEEISKALVIAFLILKLSSLRQKIIAGILFGFLFGLSENLLYLNNIFQLGDFNIFWRRFFLTGSMHIITVLVILFFGLKSKKYIILGTLGAIAIHLVFNVFWRRFFLTGSMHIITVLVILFFGLKAKKYIILGTLGAIAIHLLFNYFI